MLPYVAMISGRSADLLARTDASQARATANSAANKTEFLERRIGAIELAIETLIRLGVDSNMFTEQEFLALAGQIDAEDGKVDGIRDLNRMRKLCQDCGRVNGGSRFKCVWCGEKLAATKPMSAEDL